MLLGMLGTAGDKEEPEDEDEDLPPVALGSPEDLELQQVGKAFWKVSHFPPAT